MAVKVLSKYVYCHVLLLQQVFKQPLRHRHTQHCSTCTVHTSLNHIWYSKCPSHACTHAYSLTCSL